MVSDHLDADCVINFNAVRTSTRYMLSQCLNAFTMSLIACAEPHTAPTVPKIIKKISFPAQNLRKQNAMYPFAQMHAQGLVELGSQTNSKLAENNNTDEEEEEQSISQTVAYQLRSVLNRMI